MQFIHSTSPSSRRNLYAIILDALAMHARQQQQQLQLTSFPTLPTHKAQLKDVRAILHVLPCLVTSSHSTTAPQHHALHGTQR